MLLLYNKMKGSRIDIKAIAKDAGIKAKDLGLLDKVMAYNKTAFNKIIDKLELEACRASLNELYDILYFKEVKLEAICHRLKINTQNADIITSLLRFLANVYTVQAKVKKYGLKIWQKVKTEYSEIDNEMATFFKKETIIEERAKLQKMMKKTIIEERAKLQKMIEKNLINLYN